MRDGLGGFIQPGGAGGAVCLRVGFQAFMKVVERGVQPVAEVAFVRPGIEFGRFLQIELAQGEKAVGAGAQVAIGAGRERDNRQGAALRRGARRGRGVNGAGGAGIVCRFIQPQLQREMAHQRAGEQGLAALVALPPEQVHTRHGQGVLPGGLLGGLLRGLRGQAQVGALRRRPQAGRLGGQGQVVFIAAGQHQRGKRPAHDLRQRQQDEIGLGRGRRNEAGSFQRVSRPGGEGGQAQALAGGGQFVQGSGVRQQKGFQHARASGVLRQRLPLASSLQQIAQGRQPGGQGARGLAGGARGMDGLQGLLQMGRRVFRQALGPLAHGMAAQIGFQLGHGARGPGAGGGGELEPGQHVVAAGLAGAGMQGGHEDGGGLGGGELPARFVAHVQAVTQQGAHAAHESAVAAGQGHGRASGSQVRQHASGGAPGFAFCIRHGVQADAFWGG